MDEQKRAGTPAQVDTCARSAGETASGLPWQCLAGGVETWDGPEVEEERLATWAEVLG